MLARTLALAAGIAVAALYVPEIIAPYLSGMHADGDALVEKTVTQAAPVPAARYTGNRGAVLEADGNGHFSGLFTINGRREKGMVDTGASMVAINLATARRLGISSADLDFRYSVDTANGKARAAYVLLKRIDIGTISVTDIGAMVLEDKALSGTLIGMTFLKELSAYRVENGRMQLMR